MLTSAQCVVEILLHEDHSRVRDAKAQEGMQEKSIEFVKQGSVIYS